MEIGNLKGTPVLVSIYNHAATSLGQNCFITVDLRGGGQIYGRGRRKNGSENDQLTGQFQTGFF